MMEDEVRMSLIVLLEPKMLSLIGDWSTEARGGYGDTTDVDARRGVRRKRWRYMGKYFRRRAYEDKEQRNERANESV